MCELDTLNDFKKLNQKLENLSTDQILTWAKQQFGSKLTLASSLGPQSLVLTHKLNHLYDNPDVFFLDTARLPAETYQLLNDCMDFFNIKYRVFFPERDKVEEFIQESGPNGMYNSIAERKKCCDIRKVASLEKALDGYKGWISGVRRDQSPSRKDTSIIEYDSRFNMIKLNPLVHWTSTEVWEYIDTHNIPYNALHDQNYPSIGCEPCTRPISEGEDPRAGRWWWEEDSDLECGVNLIDSEKKVNKIELKVENIFSKSTSK